MMKAIADKVSEWANVIAAFFNQGWTGAVIGVLSILIGVSIAYYFYRQSLQGAQLAFQYRWNRLLGRKDRKLPPDVKILFRDQPIPTLCRSSVVVWNNTHKTIHGANIVEADQLRICVADDASILDAQVLARTRDVNGVVLRPGDMGLQELPFRFEFLDSADGFVVEIFHTGSTGKVSLRGTLREMPRGFKDLGTIGPFDLGAKIFAWIMLMMGLVGLALAVAFFAEILSGFSWGSLFLTLGALYLGAAFGAGGILGLLQSRCKFPRALVIPEFKSSFRRYLRGELKVSSE